MTKNQGCIDRINQGEECGILTSHPLKYFVSYWKNRAILEAQGNGFIDLTHPNPRGLLPCPDVLLTHDFYS